MKAENLVDFVLIYSDLAKNNFTYAGKNTNHKVFVTNVNVKLDSDTLSQLPPNAWKPANHKQKRLHFVNSLQKHSSFDKNGRLYVDDRKGSVQYKGMNKEYQKIAIIRETLDRINLHHGYGKIINVDMDAGTAIIQYGWSNDPKYCNYTTRKFTLLENNFVLFCGKKRKLGYQLR